MVKIRFEDDPDYKEIIEKFGGSSDIPASTHPHSDDDDPQEPEVVLDLDELARIVWEHKVYSDQDKSSKIEILHAAREASNTVGDNLIEIGDLDEKVDIGRPAIYNNLRELRDEGLIEQVGHKKSGIYRYTGRF